MEWFYTFTFLFGSLLFLFATGMPIAFAFLFINILGVFLFMNGVAGLLTLALYVFDSLAKFTLMPVLCFILMGEVLFNTGISTRALDAIDMWIGRVPGRLSLLAVLAGVLFAILSGSAIASAATLGALLVPEMTKRHYSKTMSIGPVLASGQLAVIIPPSILAVILGSLADISIGQLLVAGIIPGLVMAFFFMAYIVVYCWLWPQVAPPFAASRTSWFYKLAAFCKYVLPLSLIIFLVLGLIFLGIATPSEASALGAMGAFFLALFYGKANLLMVKTSVTEATKTTVSILMILSGSLAFSQILAFTGVSRGFIKFATGLQVEPMIVILGMLFVVIILGFFLDQISIIMLAAPLYLPVVKTLGFEPLWFGIVLLITIELGVKTPPFGLLLFVLKGVTPPDTTMNDIYRAAVPFIIMELITISTLILFPFLVTWLPAAME